MMFKANGIKSLHKPLLNSKFRSLKKLNMSTESVENNEEVLFRNENNARVFTLNRAKKLNSLSSEMIESITKRLLEYQKSQVANIVVIDTNSPKSFCAGGDVAQAVKNVKAGNVSKSSDYFYKEYSMNYLLSMYPKPIVSYLNGITMGGGVGLSVHSPFRIATEKTRLAMPEMDIGYFPDVGTSFTLPRIDGNLGRYLALTGDSLYGIDTYIAGFATHYVPEVRLPELTKRLGDLKPAHVKDLSQENITTINEATGEFFAVVNNAIEEFAEAIPKDHKFIFSNEQRNLIDKVFSESSIEGIFKNLDGVINNNAEKIDADTKEFAKEILTKLRSKSLISLKIATELLETGSKSNIKSCLNQELLIAQNLMINSDKNDFVEGVSAKLIEKTNKPNWKAKNLDEVNVQDIHLFFNSTNVEYPEIEDFFNGTDAPYKNYPYNMGLPQEIEIKNFITGDDGSKRNFAPTRQEVFDKFKLKYHNKAGLEWKVNNVLARKTKEHEFDAQYINWVE